MFKLVLNLLLLLLF